MKQKLWLTLITYLAYCIDKEHYKAIDYLREQVRVLIEHQEKENKRILLTNSQRMRVGRQGQAAQSKDVGAMHRTVHGRHCNTVASKTHC